MSTARDPKIVASVASMEVGRGESGESSIEVRKRELAMFTERRSKALGRAGEMPSE
jgi:hypothetical protein